MSQAVISPGLADVPVAESAVSFIDGKRALLAYRGIVLGCGLAPHIDDPRIGVSLDGHVVRIDLGFSATLTKTIPFNIDLKSLGLASLSSLIGVSASGQIALAKLLFRFPMGFRGGFTNERV